MIDTFAYDRRKQIGSENFFDVISKTDTQINFKNNKLEQGMIERIKYDYIWEKEVKSADKLSNTIESHLSERRLFSSVNTMAYIFVFDYFNPQSLDDICEYAKEIIDFERAKQANLTRYASSIKVFICNKYPYQTYYNSSNSFEQIKDDKNSNLIFERDPIAESIKNKIQNEVFKIFFKDLKKKGNYQEYNLNRNANLQDEKEEKVEDNLFFVNTEWNKNVDFAFETVFKRIYQVEELWKVTEFEKTSNTTDTEENKTSNVNLNEHNFFPCCFTRKDKPAKKVDKKLDKKQKSEKSNDDFIELNFKRIQNIKSEKDGFDPFMRNEDLEEDDLNDEILQKEHRRNCPIPEDEKFFPSEGNVIEQKENKVKNRMCGCIII